MREGGLGQQGRSERVFRAWSEAFQATGKAPEATSPVRFRGGELTVEVAASAVLYELRNFTGNTIRKQANQKLGSEVIRRVVFRLRT